MKKPPESSLVIRLLSLVWEHANEAVPHSWERLNHAMHAGLMLAIGSGMLFSRDDFIEMEQRFRGYRWMLEPHWYYGEAVVCGNTSAARSFEAWKGYPPYIVDDLRWNTWNTPFMHKSGCRARDRAFVGATFPYRGERVTVTSIGKDAMIACTYKPREEGSYENKVAKRFRITPADLRNKQ